MSKWIKIAGGIVVVLVGVIVAGVAILGSMDFNQYKGLIAEQAKKATGRDLQIAGNLNLEISLNPAIAVDGVTFANAAWGSRPEMVTVERFAAEVSLLPLLSGQVVVNRLLVEGVDLLAETNKDGTGNWEFTPGEKAEAGESGGDATLPSVDQVVMRGIKVTYKDGVSGEEYRVALDELTAAAGTVDAPVQIDAKGSLNEKVFKIAGTLGSVAQMTSADGVYPVDITAEALGVKTGYQGTLGTPGGNIAVDGQLSVAVASLKSTLAEASAFAPALKDVPPIRADKIDLTSKLTFDGKNASLSGMALQAGKTDIAGSARAAVGGRPNVEVALTSNLIDLDELLPAGEEKAAEPAAKPADGRVFPKDPLPLDGLKAADAKVSFDGKKLVVQGNHIEDVSVRLTLKNGNLQVDPFSAVVAGTKIGGNVGLNGAVSVPTLVAKLNAAGLDYGELLRQRGITDIASGKLDADVDVKGAGGSVRAIMASLNGKLFVKTENGKLDSNALNIVSSDVMSALPGFNSKDDKTIKCGVVNFDIKDGIANAKAIVFETGGLSAIGVGTADLREEKLNLIIDPRAKQTSLASAAVVPVAITGTFLEPEWALDKGALLGNTASTVAKGAAAFATMGLSLLAESAAKRAVGAVDTTDYCTPALAGKTVVPGKMEEAGSGGDTSSSGGSEPAKQDSGGAGGVVDGVSKGLKSLFGN
ncbi:MAG: AsmA family protein [Rhodospirillales bacterium]|nr:AsmA family protein [Rhodospirillales bacterium]MBO6786434.1 AsmA family protein [Rhodospirillales bacterium]